MLSGPERLGEDVAGRAAAGHPARPLGRGVARAHRHPLAGRRPRAGRRPDRAAAVLRASSRREQGQPARRRHRPGAAGRGEPVPLRRAVPGRVPAVPQRRDRRLRQPLESGEVTIARGEESATYPARGMVVMACNPCPCGEYSPARAATTAPAPSSSATTTRARSPVRCTTGSTSCATSCRRPAQEHDHCRATAARPRWRCASGSPRLASVSRPGTPAREWRLNSQVPSAVLAREWPLPDAGAARLERGGARRAVSADAVRCASTGWPGRWPTCASADRPSGVGRRHRVPAPAGRAPAAGRRRPAGLVSDDDRLARVALSRLTEPGDPKIASLVAQLGAVRLRELLSDPTQESPEARDVASRLRGLDPAAELERARAARPALRRARRRRVADPARRPDAGRAARPPRRSATRASG